MAVKKTKPSPRHGENHPYRGIMNAFSASMKRQRAILKLSYQDVSDRTGITKAAAFNIESGKTHPLLATARMIAKVLRFSLDDL